MNQSRHYWTGCSCRKKHSDKGSSCYHSGYQKPAPPWYPSWYNGKPEPKPKAKPKAKPDKKRKTRSRLKGSIIVECD